MSTPVRVVVVPLPLAKLIRKVFLPLNPNKMRKAHHDVVAGAKEFIRLVEEAETKPLE